MMMFTICKECPAESVMGEKLMIPVLVRHHPGLNSTRCIFATKRLILVGLFPSISGLGKLSYRRI